jgi:hypothetical protein
MNVNEITAFAAVIIATISLFFGVTAWPEGVHREKKD